MGCPHLLPSAFLWALRGGCFTLASAHDPLGPGAPGTFWDNSSGGRSSEHLTVPSHPSSELLSHLCYNKTLDFLKDFNFILEYSWLTNNTVTISCEQQRDSAIHIHVPILPQTPLLQAATKHWAEFPVLYGKTLLVIHFIYLFFSFQFPFIFGSWGNVQHNRNLKCRIGQNQEVGKQ